MAKSIVTQISGVGKSLLMPFFKQDSCPAAPFKSQNMALNPYAASEGLKIGRTQAVQAQAAGR